MPNTEQTYKQIEPKWWENHKSNQIMTVPDSIVSPPEQQWLNSLCSQASLPSSYEQTTCGEQPFHGCQRRWYFQISANRKHTFCTVCTLHVRKQCTSNAA